MNAAAANGNPANLMAMFAAPGRSGAIPETSFPQFLNLIFAPSDAASASTEPEVQTPSEPLPLYEARPVESGRIAEKIIQSMLGARLNSTARMISTQTGGARETAPRVAANKVLPSSPGLKTDIPSTADREVVAGKSVDVVTPAIQPSLVISIPKQAAEQAPPISGQSSRPVEEGAAVTSGGEAPEEKTSSMKQKSVPAAVLSKFQNISSCLPGLISSPAKTPASRSNQHASGEVARAMQAGAACVPLPAFSGQIQSFAPSPVIPVAKHSQAKGMGEARTSESLARSSPVQTNSAVSDAQVNAAPNPSAIAPNMPETDISGRAVPVAINFVAGDSTEPEAKTSSGPLAFEATLTPLNSRVDVASGKQQPEAVQASSGVAASREDFPGSRDFAVKTDSKKADPAPGTDREMVGIVDRSDVAPPATVELRTPAIRDAQPAPQMHRDPVETMRESLAPGETKSGTVPEVARPLHEIALRIPQADAAPVDLKIVERAGEIRVSVRTPDAGLQTTLRQDLGSLSATLERAGYRAETFVPKEGVAQTARAGQSDFQNSRESQGEHSGRGSGDAQEQRREQRHRNPKFAQWIEELEKSK